MNWLTQMFAAFSKPFKWWVVIAPWERGVRIRGGKVAVELRPGIHFRVPFLDRIYVQSVRERAILETGSTHTTKDGRAVVVSYAIRFAISDILRLYNAVYNPESLLAALAGGALGRYVATHDVGEITATEVESACDAELREVDSWGLERVRFTVMSLAQVRAYRIISTDYRHGAGLWDIEKEDHGER